MLEHRMQEVEEGAISAESLTEVISEEDSIEDVLVALDSSGAIRTRKAPKSIPLPRTTEQLRDRLKTLAISYTLAGYKHGSRLWLRTSTPEVWRDYTGYLLGDQVAAFHQDNEGHTVNASWTTVLNYEHAIRRNMVSRILYDNEDLQTALLASC